jgi:hypothetical protein
MKYYYATKHRILIHLLLLSVIVLNIVSCADFENINSISKDWFDSNNETAKSGNLRRYSEGDLNLPPLVEYIVDFENPTSVRYSNHLKKVCNYTKFSIGTINLKTWNAHHKISESTRVICVLDTKKLDDASVNILLNFVSQGGTLFLPQVCDDIRFGYFIGMKENAEYETDVLASGYKMTTNFLPTMQNKSFRNEAIHFGMIGENFKPSINIFATASNKPDYPLIFENKIGKGSVLNYNTSLLFDKSDRGLLFSGILMGLESIPYPIVNAATIFLDDFPSPLYDTKMEPIKSEMNLSITDFVNDVWWPDMKKIATKYNIRYTAVPAFDYNAKIDPPFLFLQWDYEKTKSNNKIEPLSSWLMRDCLKHNHELGFHGYNHVSLTKQEWKKPDFIITALEGVQKKWKVSNFKSLPISYVPPSNVIDNVGLKYLKEGLPSVTFICSLYLGELNEGGNREIDFDPFHPNLFDYPRISDGYKVSNENQYTLQSLFLYTGIWNHFIHPDDVFQIPSPFNKSAGNFDLRNADGLGWRKTNGKNYGLISEFDTYLNEFTKNFPQTRFIPASEGGYLANDWRASAYQHKQINGNYIVEKLKPQESIVENQYWFLYGSKENTQIIEKQLDDIAVIYSKAPYINGYLYSVYTKESRIVLKDLKPEKNSQLEKITQQIASDYSIYKNKVRMFQLGAVEADEDYDQKILLEIAALKERMLREPRIDSTVWNQYARYLAWDNNAEEVWPMLEKHVQKYPTKDNVMYSVELAKIVYYPNELIREKWLSAQILVTPNDKNLLNSYVADFYSVENQEKIGAALKQLLNIDTNTTTLYNYLEHLLEFDPESALKELEKIKPQNDLKGLSTNIAWLYDSNTNYQKAYDWSVYSDEIEIGTKLNWLYQLKQYDALINDYTNYIAEFPEDYKTKAAMSQYYHSMGKFKEAWILADSLPESIEKEELRKMLNTDVVYEDPLLQQYLLEFHPNLFYTNVSQQLVKSNRLKFGNYIESENELQTNRDRKSALTTVHSYNFFDKHQNEHSLAATYSEFYPLLMYDQNPLINVRLSEYKAVDQFGLQLNVLRKMYGVEYRYKNPFSFEKVQYWGRARLERDNYERFYFQMGLGINKSINKDYSSAEVNVHPAETAPAIAKEIYQIKSNLYHSKHLLNRFTTSLALESNYYTKSNSYAGIIYEDAIDVSGTLRVEWDKREEGKKMKFIPFLESAYTYGTKDSSGGFPYWMLENRFSGGGGLGWNYGLEENDFNARLEASYFLDDYSDSFQRYTGTLSYRLFNYTAIVGKFEVYSQDKFYSNSIQLGLKHNFKNKVTHKTKKSN